MLAILAMLAKGRCAWLRVAALLSSPRFRAMATDASGRDGKAGAPAEPESRIEAMRHARTGTFLFGGTRGHFYFALTPPVPDCPWGRE